MSYYNEIYSLLIKKYQDTDLYQYREWHDELLDPDVSRSTRLNLYCALDAFCAAALNHTIKTTVDRENLTAWELAGRYPIDEVLAILKTNEDRISEYLGSGAMYKATGELEAVDMDFGRFSGYLKVTRSKNAQPTSEENSIQIDSLHIPCSFSYLLDGNCILQQISCDADYFYTEGRLTTTTDIDSATNYLHTIGNNALSKERFSGEFNSLL